MQSHARSLFRYTHCAYCPIADFCALLSGKIIHIDFGDCFEVAMQREKFPERIPFRLTRMLINAMEVSGPSRLPSRLCSDL